MYINLILGAIALVVVWLYLRKLLVKDDALSESPAQLLEKELARRRETEDKNAKAFERLRDISVARMRPVASALEELHAALPLETRGFFSWEDDEEKLVVSMCNVAEEDEQAVRLTISWRILDIDLRKAASVDVDLPGTYVAKRSDGAREETLPSLDACMRYITSFVVDFMKGES